MSKISNKTSQDLGYLNPESIAAPEDNQNANKSLDAYSVALPLPLAILSLASCSAKWTFDDADGDGFAIADGDCNESDENAALIHPGAEEQDGDGIDQNCDGCDDALKNFYNDIDGDGFGNESAAHENICSTDDLPAGVSYSLISGDCDDNNAKVHPGEVVDVCDAIDNDCDTEIDEDPDVLVYRDADGDGYGDSEVMSYSCEVNKGYSAVGGDCDDAERTTFPEADEYCDEIDNDCDEVIDEDAVDETLWHADDDGDGYGNESISETACAGAATFGYVEDSTDCDDGNDDISPEASEICDAIDNDCDEAIDEADAVGASTWYLDFDGDGFGDALYTEVACENPGMHSDIAGDCADTNSEIHPLATEICNEIDDDCDGDTDDEDPDVSDPSTWYADADDDGFYVSDDTIEACSASGVYTSDVAPAIDEIDCDDAADTVYPGADEVLDGADNDCDTDTDEYGTRFSGESASSSAGQALAWVPDVDGDGLDDLLVGAYLQSEGSLTSQGAAYLASGRSAGESELAAAMTTFRGESSLDRAGYRVSAAGDVNADGHSDVLIGASGYPSGAINGAVYLVNGPFVASTEILLADVGDTVAGAAIYGEEYNGLFGSDLTTMADLDGDGYDDFIVGASRNSNGAYSNSGVTYYFSGPVSGTLSPLDATEIISGEETNLYSGNHVANLGDVDGDGVDDLGITASGINSAAGGFYVVNGALTTMGLSDADALIAGSTPNREAGQSIAGNCDVDGDGTPDVALGSTSFSSSGSTSYEGAVFLFTTTLTGELALESDYEARIEGAVAGDQVGSSVSLADVNSDGNCDVVLGAENQGTNGAAHLFLGAVSGAFVTSSADVTWDGEASGDYFGFPVTATGDANGDGFYDIAIGAYANDAAASNAGAAYLFLGGEGGI